ncbi:MAG: head-tail connector protein [Sphingopyxis sp.]
MVDLALAKQHLEYDDSDRDTLIQQYIAAAAAWIEHYTGHLLARRAVTVRFASDVPWLDIDVGPNIVVDSLTYLDTDLQHVTVPSSDYVLVDRRLYPASAFPYARHGLLATVTAGFDGDVPADLASAQLLLVGHQFANREAVVVGTIASQLPFGVTALCDNYRAVKV